MSNPAIDITELFSVDAASSTTSPQSLPVTKWKNVCVRLFCTGTALSEIARMLGQEVEDVKAFVHSPKGKFLIKEMSREDDLAYETLLEGARMDNLLELLRVRDHGSSDTCKLNAVKALNELSDSHGGKKSALSPEEAKKELEAILERTRK